jgi:Patatin-like phospholipase
VSRPEPEEVVPAEEAPPGSPLGLSLSGGGIRSAAFSLGVCQRLIEEGTLARAKYLSAVSGGGYIAAGLAISHAEDRRSEAEAGERPPWGRDSPEETSLRRNLSYLAPGSRGRLWLGANLLYGLILNLTPLVLAAYVSGRVIGVLLGLIYPGLGHAEDVNVLGGAVALCVVVALVLGSTLVVGSRRFFDKDEFRERLVTYRGERWVVILLYAAACVLALAVVLPAMILLIAEVSGGAAAGFGPGEIGFVPRRLVFGLIIVAISIAMGGFAVWLLRQRHLALLRGALAYLSGLGILFAPFLLGAQTGAAAGFSPGRDLPWFGLSALILVGFAVFVHNRRYSMHLFYRERLQEAFALRRVRNPGPGEKKVESIPYDESVNLTVIDKKRRARIDAGGQPFPKLIMCAAVAARGSEVPNKSWAASFTFEADYCGSESAELKGSTADLEHGDWLGGGDVTLPGMMAISGAAISPMMGRFTLPGFRFLIAMLNIRLGVWLRNPRHGRPQEPDDIGRLHCLARYVAKGWHEPGAFYVLKEALGLAGAKGDYVYVSDGGHWENLGLTELLRKGCTDVIVVDASGAPGPGDIGRAIAVARAELGLDFRFDPSSTIGGEDGMAASPIAKGSFFYPDGQEGTIYYARCVLWKEAPSDLRFFAESDPVFPRHPTSNQFLSGELFEAYRALGWAVGDRLVPELSLPPEDWERPPEPALDGSA